MVSVGVIKVIKVIRQIAKYIQGSQADPGSKVYIPNYILIYRS